MCFCSAFQCQAEGKEERWDMCENWVYWCGYQPSSGWGQESIPGSTHGERLQLPNWLLECWLEVWISLSLMGWWQQCPLCCWGGWPTACGAELLPLADAPPCVLDPTRGTILWGSDWHLNQVQSCAWGSLAVVGVVSSQNSVSHPRRWLPWLNYLFSEMPGVNKKETMHFFPIFSIWSCISRVEDEAVLCTVLLRCFWLQLGAVAGLFLSCNAKCWIFIPVSLAHKKNQLQPKPKQFYTKILFLTPKWVLKTNFFLGTEGEAKERGAAFRKSDFWERCWKHLGFFLNLSPDAKPCRGGGWGGRLLLNTWGSEMQSQSWDLLKCSNVL